MAVWRIRRDSREPHSHFRSCQPGNDFKDEAAPLPHEPVIVKRANSAFIGTDLEQRLKKDGHRRIVIAGVSTSNSVEARVRMAGNLDYPVWLVEDDCFTFAKRDWNDVARSAEEVHAMSLANLDGEYCAVTTTNAVIGG